MSQELFPESEVSMNSPRFSWIKRMQCVTFHSVEDIEGPVWFADFDAGVYDYENSADYFFWRLGAQGENTHDVGIGHTEDDAIADLRKHAVKMRNEEDVP